MRIAAISALMLVGINSALAETPAGPNLGQPASRAAIARWEMGVMPDGTGLPPGSGTASQGKAIYAQQCLSCHGPGGQGDSADQLAGAQMGLASEYPEKTIGSYWPFATTLFDMTRRSMPMQNPGSLTDDEAYAVTAYLLYLNAIINESEIMSAKTLPKVKMPNRHGFINVYELESQKE